MGKFNELRREMVDEQLVGRGISDPQVISAMRKVPRHEFFLREFVDNAYSDGAYPIGERQTISQPYMVAAMTEQMELKGGDKVLEIGTGSGYQAAILAEIAGTVYTVECNIRLAERVKATISKLGYKNIELFNGDGALGLAEFAPYDAIMVTAASPRVPQPLIDQLSENGRLVIPVGDKTVQILKQIRKKDGKTIETDSISCVFVPLMGKYGWPS